METVKVTYKTVSVERRDHIASPLHYGLWPRESLLARLEPVRRSVPGIRRVKESLDSPVGIGGNVSRFTRRGSTA